MTIFPAVDIQNGRAVRLRQGRKEDSTIFAENPLDMARHWLELGASWLHVVDLDGAFDGSRVNAPIIGRICAELGMSVQAGGGIRSLEAARQYLDAGVTRLIIGTLALERPQTFTDMCREFPGRIGVSLDADKGRLKSRGWLKDSGLEIREVLPRLEDQGASFIIYTDIERDGMRNGINLEALASLLRATRLPVIAAGGVADMKDVAAIYSMRNEGNLAGMITGRAIYEKSLDLAEALAWLKIQERI